METRKKLSVLLVLAMLLSLSFSSVAIAKEAVFETMAYQTTGYEASAVTLVREGTAINDFQIGFKPPSDKRKQRDLQTKFDSWLVIYSTKSIDEVWSHLQSLTPAQILDYSNTSGTNRIYRITNYSWADGLGNTYSTNQKDVVTGAAFGPGIQHFYVATRTTDGIVGLAEANKTVDIMPYPKDITLQGTGTSIENYSVNFSSFDHPSITHNLIFYSKDVLYRDSIQNLFNMTRAELQALSDTNKAKMVTALQGPISFNVGQKEIDGTAFGSGLYYVYVATVGETGILRMSQAVKNIITAPLPTAKTTIGDGVGTVYPVGGSTSQANYDHLKSLSNVTIPRIAIFNSARDDMDTVFNHFYYDDPTYGSLEDNFAAMGFEPVFIPLAIDSASYVANEPYYAALVKSCDMVWLQGGDQNKHARSLLNDDGSDTLIMGAIRSVYNAGGVVAGTSAGMHIMSNPSFGYGVSYDALKANSTEFYGISAIPTSGDLFPAITDNNLAVPGIGMVPSNVLNDTHFDARGRLGRLLVAMRDTGKTIGIGADEGTGISIKNNIGTVVGLNGVFIVDVANATYSPSGSNNLFSVTGAKIHYLTEGDTYNFTTKAVTVSADKTPISERNATLYSTTDIFAPYETTKSMISLAENTANTLIAPVYSDAAPTFDMTLRKDANTKAYQSNVSYSTSDLSGYNKTTIIGMNLDLQDPSGTVPTEPQVLGVTHYSYQDEAWIEFSEEIDPATVNQTTVKIVGNTYYSSSYPLVDSSYPNEIDVRASKNFTAGNQIIISGVKNLNGIAVETQTWEKASDGTWFKVSP